MTTAQYMLNDFEEELDNELFGLIPEDREGDEFFRKDDFHHLMKIVEENTLTSSVRESCQRTSNVEDLDFPDPLEQVIYNNSSEGYGQIVMQGVHDFEDRPMEIQPEEVPRHLAEVTKKTSNDMSKPAVISASTLLALQNQTPFEYEKATNMAKFITRYFMKRYADFLPEDREKELHQKFVERYFERNERKNKTSSDMVFLFGMHLNERNNRWANLRRLIMHRILSETCKRKLILENNYIKSKQKIHYLYSLKIYEWRLNQPQLVANFN